MAPTEAQTPGSATMDVLVQKRDALVTALTQLSHAAQDASWATIEYFQALHPDSDRRHPPPAFHHVYSAARTLAGAAAPGAREDDELSVNGKHGKKAGKMSRAERKKAKDPNEPKRPVTAYFLFLQHARPQLSKDMPDAKGNELQQEATERWNSMSEEDKRPYKDLYEANYAKFRKEMEEYKAKKEGRPVTATEDGAAANADEAVEEAEESDAEEATPARPTKMAKTDSTKSGRASAKKIKEKETPSKAKKETSKRNAKKKAPSPEAAEAEAPKTTPKKDRKRKR